MEPIGDPDDASQVLDWLGVRRRHHAPASPNLPPGLVLIDLPDAGRMLR